MPHLESVLRLLEDGYHHGHRIFIMGNGGLYECSVSDVAEENATAIAVMRWTLGNRRTQTFSCTLVDASGGWKISLIGLPR